MNSTLHPAVAILGPTGSGKSRLGIALAQRFGGEIVNCDALQVYRNMDVGTAKPTAEEQGQTPHHMLDLRDPDEEFSAGDYLRAGRDVLRAIRGRAQLPLVVGGTGFYFRALTDGLFEGPGRSEELRERMRRILARKGPPPLFRMLQRIDPVSADHIMPADAARIIRACEVYLLTGHPMSWWQAQPRDRLHGFRWLKFGIGWPREVLYRRIEERVTAMFRGGFVDEVRALLEQYPRECQAFKAIGYTQIAAYIDGSVTLTQAIEETQRESRRYAKRQLTWFRRDPEMIWLDGTRSEDGLVGQAARLIGEFTTVSHAPERTEEHEN